MWIYVFVYRRCTIMSWVTQVTSGYPLPSQSSRNSQHHQLLKLWKPSRDRQNKVGALQRDCDVINSLTLAPLTRSLACPARTSHWIWSFWPLSASIKVSTWCQLTLPPSPWQCHLVFFISSPWQCVLCSINSTQLFTAFL